MGTESSQYPKLHETPEFYRHVLEGLPMPVIVIDAAGEILYGNRAIFDLTGWTVDHAFGENLLEYLHPEDAPWVLEAFANLVKVAEPNAQLGASKRTPLRLRVMAKDGAIIPVEVTGEAGPADSDTRAFMFSVRPAGVEAIRDDVFAGLAAGDSIESLMQLIVDIVTLPPLGLAAAVYEQHADGSDRMVASSDPRFEGLPVKCTDRVPWAGLRTKTATVEIDALPDEARAHLVASGFKDCLHAGAHAPDVSTTLRLVACSSEHPDSTFAAVQRLERARELMSIVLLKLHDDRVLERAATLDSVTGLPNRLGLTRCLEQIEASSDDCALLIVNIDNYQLVNDLHGELVGDRVLTAAADRLRRAVRADDIVTRLHRDEFAVLLSGTTATLNPDTVRCLAERVAKMFAEPVGIDGLTLTISASVLVAYLDGEQDRDRLMGSAYETLTAEKWIGLDHPPVASVYAT